MIVVFSDPEYAALFAPTRGPGPACKAAPVSSVPCPFPGVALVRMVCEHGHVREGLMCEPHAADAASPGPLAQCLPCGEGPDGHACALTFLGSSPAGGEPQ
jgi:hypothetical protein